MNQAKRYAPAAGRNAEPIMSMLENLLPNTGTVLEIASGTGQHAAEFAQRFRHLHWQPSDIEPTSIESIAAYVSEAQLDNLQAPIRIDTVSETWQCSTVETILAINLLHIAPWSAALGLFSGAQRHLSSDGIVVLYGPFRFFGQVNAPSNVRFDQQLRRECSDWGLRDLMDVCHAAGEQGLRLDAVLPMPANNHILVFKRSLSC